MFTERLMRLPPDSHMPRQLVNDSETNLYVGTVEIVLSQFCTFTVVKLISSTSPSAPWLGITIQSPMRIILFAINCTHATKPNIVSLNTNISTAAKAPIPTNRASGDLPMEMLMTMTPAAQ